MSTDTNTDPQLPEGDQPPADDPTETQPAENKGSGRFSVYDKDELRFTGGVHDTRKAANELKSSRGKGKRSGRYEVREV